MTTDWLEPAKKVWPSAKVGVESGRIGPGVEVTTPLPDEDGDETEGAGIAGVRLVVDGVGIRSGASRLGWGPGAADGEGHFLRG